MFSSAIDQDQPRQAARKILSDAGRCHAYRSLSGKFEHSVGVTHDGVEISALSPGKLRPA